LLSGAGLFFFMLAVGAVGWSGGSPTAGANEAADSFVMAYSNSVNQIRYGLTPESVGATSDGGYFALGLADSPAGILTNWLLKLDGSGRPRWQKDHVCANGAPGYYALGISAQQLADGARLH